MRILKTLLRGFGYSVGFLLLTIFFTLVTFPEDRLLEYVEVMAAQATGGRVSISELNLSVAGNVELVDAVLTMPAPESQEGASKRLGGMLKVDKLYASPSLFGLLDEVVDESAVVARAIEDATGFAELDQRSYAKTAEIVRGDVVAEMRAVDPRSIL